MKPRTVIVTLELETDVGLATLKDPLLWVRCPTQAQCWHVQQVTVHVAQPPKPKGKRRAK